MNTNKGMKLKPRTATRLKIRQVYAAAFAFLLVAGSLFVAINFSGNTESKGAVNGDYRSAASGSWSTVATWQTYNGSAWVAATTVPTTANGTISIESGHTVTVSGSVTADQLVVTGKLDIQSGSLTIANGAGMDLQVDGTLEITSTLIFSGNAMATINGIERLKSTGTVSIGSGARQTIAAAGRLIREGGTFPTGTSSSLTVAGTFEHAMDGGVLPSATWSSGSTVEITGAITTPPTNLSQSFKNFTWNSTLQTDLINLSAALSAVGENFEMKSTGTGSLMLDQQGNNSILNVAGNFIMTGGYMYGCTNGSTDINITGNYLQTGGTFAFTRTGGTAYGNTSTAVRVTGYAAVSGGTLDLSQCDANNSSKGMGMFYVKGNCTFSGTSLVTVTSTASRGQIIFNGTTEQVYSSAESVTGLIDYIVSSGSILRLDQQIVKSSGNFTLNSTGGVILGDAAGITSSGATGNVQVTGSRSYSTTADYTYQATFTQVTGNGLPATVRNLTFNNNAGITLTSSVAASGTLTLTDGNVTTNSNVLTLGTSTSVRGTLVRSAGYVIGSFCRWFTNATASNMLFPVGSVSSYNGINFNITAAPSAGGTITAQFVRTTVGLAGLPITEGSDICSTASDFYWQLTAGNGFTGGTWSVNAYANGITGVNDYTKLHLIRRANSASNWTFHGTHVATTGSNAAPVMNRSSMTLLGHYGIGSTNSNSLPIELLYFRAKANGNKVDLTWATSAEKDNDYFTVERSTDGRNFESVFTKPGAGNSKTVLTYSGVDEHPVGSLIYYRLMQTDFDGKFTYSPIASVRFETSASNSKMKIASLGPNPFHQNFRLQYEMEESGNVDIVLMNLAGQVVYRDTRTAEMGLNEFEFSDESGLPSGTYILNIVSGENRLTQKLIKN